METFTPISRSDIMSWEDILKQNKFDFNKLNFKKRFDGEKVKGWRAIHDFGEGVQFSIVTGGMSYSKPRDEILEDPMQYQQYEVMLSHPKVKHPQEIGIMENTMVFGYVTKEEITEYARKVEANLPSKMKEKEQGKNLGRLIDAFKE